MESRLGQNVRETSARLTRLERRQIRNGVRGMPGDVGWTAADTPPAGALPMDGQSVLRSDYPRLFARIGTRYGSVDANHFNLPDARGRTLVHLGSGQFSPLGAAPGTETVALTVAQMPSHNHEPGASGQSFLYGKGTTARRTTPGGSGSQWAHTSTVQNDLDRTAGTANAGSGAAHPNVQPSLVLLGYIWT